jgi:hypothetical protein
MKPARRPADLPLLLLVGLALLFVTGLGALMAAGGLPDDPIGACSTAVAAAAARLTTLGILAPAGILSVVLLAAGLALTHQLVATRRLLRELLDVRVATPSAVRQAAASAGLTDLDVVADGRAFVFCYGYMAPRVCISTALCALLSNEELGAVLRHEAHHVRHRDPLRILVGRTFASGLFFLPAGGALRNGFLTGKEICADREAIAAGDALALPRALVKMLGAERPQWPAGVLAVGAMTPTEARIHSLLDEGAPDTLPRVMDWIATVAVVAGIFGFSIGSAAAREDRRVLGSCSPPVAAAHHFTGLASAVGVDAIP